MLRFVVRMVLVAALLTPAAGPAATPRKQCAKACKTAIDACAAGGTKRRLCKRDLLRQCRRDGIAACEPTTTTTTSTTTTTTIPAPANLRVFSRLEGPPAYDLRFDGAPGIAEYVILESPAAFTSPDEAQIAAVAPGAASEAAIELRAGTGSRHFRAMAIDFTGAESPLSTELVVDTTPRLVMLEDKNTNDTFELFSVLPGSADEPASVSGPVSVGLLVSEFFMAPDGRHVAFTSDLGTPACYQLFVAPLDASSAPVKVSGTLVAGGCVDPFLIAWAPDGAKLAFTADKRTDEVTELFVAPADGSSEPVAVSGMLAAGGEVFGNGFAWSPDGRHVAFLADKLTDGTQELFVATPDGTSEPVRVSGTLISGGQVAGFAWAPDGTRLAMRARKESTNYEFFVLAADGSGTAVKVSGVLPAFASSNSNPLWSPDGTRIAFSGDLLTDGVFELFVTPVDGIGVPRRVSGQSQAFTDMGEFVWSPDGTRLLFTMDKNTDDAREVFVVSAADGEEPTRVSGAFVAGRHAFQPTWSPTGDHVAYYADANTANKFELFTAEPDVADAPVAVSGTFGAAQDVSDYAWSPDGRALAVVGDLASDNDFELFLASPSGGANPIKASGTGVMGSDVVFAQWAPLSN